MNQNVVLPVVETPPYNVVISEGSYIGKSEARRHDMFRWRDRFFMINRLTGHVFEVPDDSLLCNEE